MSVYNDCVGLSVYYYFNNFNIPKTCFYGFNSNRPSLEKTAATCRLLLWFQVLVRTYETQVERERDGYIEIEKVCLYMCKKEREKEKEMQ